MEFYQEIITPDKAREYLATSPRNPRFVSPGKAVISDYVERIANDIKNGAWAMSGDTIKFDDTGKLVDGHHRLSAIVKANMSVPCLVVKGVGDEGQEKVDCNRVRTVQARLELPQFYIADARLHYCMLNGGGTYRLKTVSESEIKKFVRENEGILQKVASWRIRKTINRTRILKLTSFDVAIIHAVKCGVSDDEIENIVYKLTTGDINYTSESSLFKLREWIRDNSVQNDLARVKTCSIIQQYMYDYLHGINRPRVYRSPRPIYTLKLIGFENGQN